MSTATALLLILVALFACVQAQRLPIATAGDQYCSDLLFRGGCAQCEASPDCDFCAPSSATYQGACRAKSSEANCDALIERLGFVSAEEGSLCPTSIGPGVYQAAIVNSEFNPNDPDDVKDATRFTTFNDGFFCDIGHAYPFDRYAFQVLHSGNPSSNDDVCNIVNHQFGLSFSSCDCCCCDDDNNVHTPHVLETYNPITTAEELVTEVMQNCAGGLQRDAVPNPYSSENTLECIKLMQEAYCTVGCPAYDKEQGKFCRSGTEIDELYRLCAPYTNGPGNEPRERCPLDPNSLPLADIDDETSFAPTFCDGNLKSIHETGIFTSEFKLLDGVIPEAAAARSGASCEELCSATCNGKMCSVGGTCGVIPT